MRRVDPKVYTKEYYLSDCTGHEEFRKSFGKKLDVSLGEYTKYLSIEKGMRVLDIGCGRGELVFYCASKGAKAIGIDYSKDSIILANLAKKKQPGKVKDNSGFKVMDAKDLKFNDSSFDLVIFTGVYEHLYPEEVKVVFSEIKRILKNSGLLMLDTAPNRIFNDYTYRFYCYPVGTFITFVWNKLLGKNYPNIGKPEHSRKESHKIMHVNEPTFSNLNRDLSKYNFVGKLQSTNITVIKPVISFKDRLFNLIIFLDPLSRYFPLNILFGSDFVGVFKNKK